MAQERARERAYLLDPSLLLRDATPHRYDNKASDLTAAGMKDGVSKTGCFLLFLSAGVMARPYVQVIRRFVVRALRSFGVNCLLPLCPN